MTPGTEIHSIRATPGELRFTVELGESSHEIWIRSSVPVVAGADAAVALTLVAAMTRPGPLRVEAPVEEAFVRRLAEIQAVLGSWQKQGDWAAIAPLGHQVELVCALADPPPHARDRRTAAFFSGGVDSFFTVLRNHAITDLIYIEGLDVPVGEAYADHHARVRETVVGEVAERLGKSVIIVETNARELYEPSLEGPVYGGNIRAAVARFLAPEIARVYVASAQHYDWLFPNSAHPMLDHLWGTGGLELIHDGAEITRVEKVQAIARDEAARAVLRVCWESPGSGRNCGRCEKCLRTMVTLEALGERGRFETFPPQLDLEAVAAARPDTNPNVAFWKENLELAVSRHASGELIAAIEACLASVERPASAAAGLGEPVAAEEHRALVVAHEQAQARLAELRELAAWQESRLRDISESASWRWTAPLRAGTGLWRRGRSPG